MHWGKRVAQAATPDQPAGSDQPPADGTTPPPAPDPAAPAADPPSDADPPPAADPAAADPAVPAAAPPPDPVPEATPDATPTPVVEQTPNLSDEELEKLAEQEAKEEVITVTGSTIERKTLTTPAPLTILNRDDLNASGRATVGDIIQQLPAQSNAINAQINNGGDGSTRVDIRGLGAARTLTLLNGRRLVPGGTGADTSVDINSIPLAVIERVEVLKDGASAIYGSDAIGGVVNIITRTDFHGTEASIYTGVSPAGDGLTYDASFVTGHNSENKKGNILFSAGIQEQQSIFAGDRAFSKIDRDFDFDAKTVSIGGSPTIPNGRINARAFDTNGDGAANSMDTAVDVCGVGEGLCTNDTINGGFRPLADTDVYNFQPVNYLLTPSSRYNVYSTGTYKLTPEVTTFFEASYLRRTSDQQLAPEPLVLNGGLNISKDSIYNPFDLDLYGYNRRLEEFGPRRTLQNNGTFRMVGGAQGVIPDDAPALKNWKWEVSYNFGRNDSTQEREGNLIRSHVANALGPSFVNASGVAQCGMPSAVIPGCVPIDVLGPSGSIDTAARDYATFTGIQSGFSQQQTVLAQTHGSIAKLPNNGDLSVAFGADYRKEDGGQTPDPLTSTGDTTGNFTAPTAGSYNVVEGYGEISLVPLSGKKFAEWVELNAAARAFRYDTFGSDVTWKLGGLFRTVSGVAVRGTYSTAFRAPSIGELYSGQFEGFPSVPDPCDTRPPGSMGPVVLAPSVAEQCAREGVAPDAQFGTRQQRQVSGGNVNLQPETANIITTGVVFEPPQVKGLSLTADYWNIDITKAITGLATSTILTNCYNVGIQSFCDQIHRDPARSNQIDFIENPISNVGGTTTSGLDFAAVYDHKAGTAGRFRNQIEAQYLFKYNLDNSLTVTHGRGNYDLGVYPKYKANFSSAWHHPSGASVGLNVRWVGSFRECDSNDCNGGGTPREVPNYFKSDLFGSYMLKSTAGTTTIAAGVNNLLNATPPVIYIGAPDSDGATYDFVGRFLYVRLSQLF
jgi:outer membrane receptor protein involved in Fe transport